MRYFLNTLLHYPFVVQVNNDNKLYKIFPLYEAIALLEKNQKHPIAEIMYSFSVRKIQKVGKSCCSKNMGNKNNKINKFIIWLF